jgi:TP901-1 family phage major tail protein
MRGIDILVKVNTGTAQTPTYTAVAGQRGATLNRSAETIDLTNKEGDGWADSEV